ncbi:MAG: DUF4097 family beta strand repeat-containing protein [Thermomicrobiales bacterium]
MENGRIERTFTLAPGVTPTIVTRIPSGTMQIHGEERNDVAVTITVQPANAIGRDLEIILEEQAETIHAEVRGQGRGDSLFGLLRSGVNGVRIAMEIHTPLRSNVEAEAASADIDMERLEGTIRVRTASGDIRADRLSQSVTIQTASGDVTTHTLTGHVHIQSASGDIGIKRAEGEVGIQSASGDVSLDQISGTLDVSTASGDCQVRSSALNSCRAKTASGDLNVITPLAPEGDYEFSTVSGDLLLQVPQETRMTVSMQTLSGDLSCALPSTTTEGGKRRRTLAVNGGGVPVRVKSVSGDCAIRAANSNLPPLPATAPLHATMSAAPPVPPTPPRPPMPPMPGAAIPMPDAPPESDFSESLAVLQAVERGELTIDEAMAKLATLEDGPPTP